MARFIMDGCDALPQMMLTNTSGATTIALSGEARSLVSTGSDSAKKECMVQDSSSHHISPWFPERFLEEYLSRSDCWVSSESRTAESLEREYPL